MRNEEANSHVKCLSESDDLRGIQTNRMGFVASGRECLGRNWGEREDDCDDDDVFSWLWVFME